MSTGFLNMLDMWDVEPCSQLYCWALAKMHCCSTLHEGAAEGVAGIVGNIINIIHLESHINDYTAI